MKILIAFIALTASCYGQVVNPGQGSGGGGGGAPSGPAGGGLTGTYPNPLLANPSASTLGGVQSIAAVSHNFLTAISTSGVPSAAQPAFTDISGSLAAGQLPATSVTSTLALANLGALVGSGGQGLQSSSQLLVSNLGTSGTEAWTLTNTALATTPTGGYGLTNSTAAAAAAQQVSPPFTWTGQGWKTTSTAASQAVSFRSYVLPVQGTSSPTGQWNLDSSINGGAYSNIMSVSNTGVGVFAGGTTGNPGSGATPSVVGGFATSGFSSAQFAAQIIVSGNVVASAGTSSFTIPQGNNFVWFNDTALSRVSAGVVGIVNGTSGNSNGKLNAGGATFVDGTATIGATRIVGSLGAADTATTNIFSLAGSQNFLIGAGLVFKTGSNARLGSGTLVGGTLAVANTSITANSHVFIVDTTAGALTNVGSLVVVSKTAGVGFTVTSSNVLDTSTFDYWIHEGN